MRNLNGFICICLLAMMSSTASAQIKIVIDNQEIPTEHIESINILPNSNLISVITNVAYTVTADSAPPPPAGEVAITGFSVSPSSSIVDETTTVSWTTLDATFCKPTGGAGGWNKRIIGLPNSSTTVNIGTAGTYDFTLTCEGDAGVPAVATRTVVVNPPPVDPPPPPPAEGNCTTPALSGVVSNWSDLFQTDFPMPISGSQFVQIPIGGYYALKFNTGSVVDDGKMTSIETTITDGVRLGSYSQCPGDFNVPAECEFIWGQSGGLRWATNGRADACQLEPNTTYYFNITFTDGFNSSTTTCNGSPCYTILQPTNP